MKTAEQILREHLKPDWMFGGDSGKAILSAMEEYASQSAGQGSGFTNEQIDAFFKWAFKAEEWHWNGESFEENTGHDDYETYTPSELFNQFINSNP